MSWGIYTIGTRKGVKRMVEKAQAYGTDQSQIELAKQLIFQEIDAYPESVQGLRIEASGHHDQYSRNLSIRIEAVQLAFDDEDPKPSE